MQKYLKILNVIFLIILINLINPGCKKSTDPPPVVPPDTTTHNYEWTVSQFGTGAGSSYLYDVFAIAEDDVWAVGKITTNEQDSLGNDLDPYNIIHWDGTDWNLDRVLYSGIAVPGQAVFGFNEDEVYIVAGSTFKWDGTGWTDLNVPFGIFNGNVTKFWGTSSSNLYFVGGNGTLVHYNGSDWTKIDSGTDMNILDIWGFDDGTFYCVAGMGINQPNELLIYNNNGQLVRKITHQKNLKNSLWGIAPNNIYAVGEGLFHFNGIDSLKMIEWPTEIPKFAMSSVGGTKENNIFVAGAFGFVMHYNGQTWYYYDELYAENIIKSVSVVENQVISVGLDGLKAFIYHGKKITN